MTRLSLRIGIFFFLSMGTVLQAGAERRAHRPWLMIHTRSQTPPPVVETPYVRGDPAPETKRSSRGHGTGHAIANQALLYKGTRYKFGGTTKKGLDCSGLVNRIYADLKLNNLPRASKALFQKGHPVQLEDLQPGDLVFFKNTYRRGISHVGIYAGSNRFVHASNHRRGVTVTSLSDPYYQLHYAGARRLY